MYRTRSTLGLKYQDTLSPLLLLLLILLVLASVIISL